MPLTTQSDPGSENYGIANFQTYVRHACDPRLAIANTLQHRWKTDKKNVIPEIFWSQLRSRWAPGFEDLIQLGIDQGWYCVDNFVQRYDGTVNQWAHQLTCSR